MGLISNGTTLFDAGAMAAGLAGNMVFMKKLTASDSANLTFVHGSGGVDFTTKFISLNGQDYASLEAAKEAGAAVMTYGNLVQALINFVIIAFFIFVILRAAEKFKKKEEAVVAAPAGPSQEELLMQIRDLLKK